MSGQQICKRCNDEEASVVSRKEWFCDKCFQKFVSLKQRKQMMSDEYFQELFKVIYQDKKKTLEEAEKINQESRILVPLSLGSSSLVMLDIINDTLSEQKQTHKGKTGFHIDVLTLVFADEISEAKRRIEFLKNGRYSSNKDKLTFHIVEIETFFQDGLDLSRIFLDDVEYSAKKAASESKNYSVAELLSSCSNRSAREDILSIITDKIIKTFAYQGKYKAILWGHSMTKLADGIVSQVVKGRGSQIADALNDESFDSDYHSQFKNLHPLRDVLLSEIDAYCYIAGLNGYTYKYVAQDSLLLKKVEKNEPNNASSRLAKNMTINELARQYFENIEDDYSNIISTVVRTGAKLANPVDASSNSSKCHICDSRIFKDGSLWLRDITVNAGHPIEGNEDQTHFKAWSESQLGKERGEYMTLKMAMIDQGIDIPICYGCIVTLRDIKNKTVLWPKNGRAEVRNILEEFTLSDVDDSIDDAMD